MSLIAIALNLLSIAVFWATIAVAFLFFLRVILTWLGANPFGRVSYYLTRYTEPVIRPIRSQLGGVRMRYDLIPLVMGVMILVTGLFIASILGQFAAIFVSLSLSSFNARVLLVNLINFLGLLYVVAIFLRFFLPFFGVGYSNRLMRFLFVITEPLLKPLRRIFVAGMFDFSPLIAMLIVQVVTSILVSLVA
ncbi:MAG TPA: YggT family protein [Blastocatellia bacterium]|nr:YggT family protein [Blastocatellia bacterium]